MDPVVHFEIPVDDAVRAKEFYRSIFGWELGEMPGMDYTYVITTPVDERQMPTEPGAINGGMMARTESISSPVFAINVGSVDDYVAKVEAAGGVVVAPKMEIPGMGLYAYVRDTEGNVVGLWQDLAGH